MKNNPLYTPFWKGGKVVEESVILVEKEGKRVGNLLFSPSRILSVKSYDDSKIFEEKEYRFEGRQIIAALNSSLPYMTEAFTHGGDGAKEQGLSTMEDLVFTEDCGIVRFQIKVTYEYEESDWEILPPFKGDKLLHTLEMGQAKQPLKVVLYGDSISAGCHASSVLGYGACLPIWGQTITEALGEKFSVDATLQNLSVGGYISRHGLESVEEKLATVERDTIDLAILAFGMNDGSWKVPYEEYLSNMTELVKRFRAHSPKCDIVLISTILANPLCSQDKALTSSYRRANLHLESTVERCVEVDMTSVCQALFKRKSGLDLFANNINHPTDFFVRIYVMYLTQTLLGE